MDSFNGMGRVRTMYAHKSADPRQLEFEPGKKANRLLITCIICTPSLFLLLLLLLLFLLTLLLLLLTHLLLLFYHHQYTFAPPGEIIVLIASSETGWAKGNALPYPPNSSLPSCCTPLALLSHLSPQQANCAVVKGFSQ